MKKQFIIACLAILIGQFEGICQDMGGMTSFVKSDIEGTITVTASGFAKKKPESMANASSNAFYTLMFRGIPGSQYKSPMIPNEQEFKNNPVVVEILKGGYASFLTDSSLQSEAKLKRKEDGVKGIQTQMVMTINCNALRRYLEDKKIIRKFGL